MSRELCVKFGTRDPYRWSHQSKYSSHSHGSLREHIKMEFGVRWIKGHLTGDRERKSEEGNLRYLIRDVRKHFFSTFLI